MLQSAPWPPSFLCILLLLFITGTINLFFILSLSRRSSDDDDDKFFYFKKMREKKEIEIAGQARMVQKEITKDVKLYSTCSSNNFVQHATQRALRASSGSLMRIAIIS